MITALNQSHSIISHLLAEIRDKNIQSDRIRFRHNIALLGTLIGYEVTKTLDYTDIKVTTPLGVAAEATITRPIVLATILRAGLSMHNGMLQLMPDAENAYVSAYRKEGGVDEIEIVVEYLAAPDLTGKTLIIADPMIATGRSSVLSYRALCKHGTPKTVHIACAIASEAGVEYVSQQIPHAHIWAAAVDKKLDENAYIVPGLGDAGDLAYGPKNS